MICKVREGPPDQKSIQSMLRFESRTWSRTWHAQKI